MTQISLMPMLAFDYETTGVDVYADRIVTGHLSLHLPTPDGVSSYVPEGHVFDFIVDPGIDIPAGASAIHGVTTERARAEGRQPFAAVTEITAIIRHYALPTTIVDGVAYAASGLEPALLTGFNLSYDLTLHESERQRHTPALDALPMFGEFDLPTNPPAAASGQPLRPSRPSIAVADGYVLDKFLFPRRRGKGARKLSSLAPAYGVPLGDDAHNADADAIASARIVRKQLRMLEQRADQLRANPLASSPLTAHSLHALQIMWKKQQALDLAAYFRRQGNRQPDVDLGWPLQTGRIG